VVPFKVLDVTQVQIAQPKAPAAVVARQSDQPVSNLLVLGITLGHIAIAGLADAKDGTG
jgi:hypothetical protein